jgi:hypothetical protein
MRGLSIRLMFMICSTNLTATDQVRIDPHYRTGKNLPSERVLSPETERVRAISLAQKLGKIDN